MKGADDKMMEHEMVNDKTVALSIRCAKLTGRTLAMAMQAFLKAARNPAEKHGKQSLKSLAKQGASLADIEISGDNIGKFRRTARKYNVDFALKRDKSADPPKWVVFFKAKDDKALQAAFGEYAKKTLKKKARKPSMLAKLKRNKGIAKEAHHKVKERAKGVRRKGGQSI